MAQFEKIKFISLVIVLFYYSCIPLETTLNTNKASYKNINGVYNPGSSILHPEFFIYHNSDSASQLYVKIFPDELFYSKTSEKNESFAKLKIHYDIYKSYETNEIIDSASVVLNLNKKNFGQPLISYLNLKKQDLDKYLLIVTTQDIYRDVNRKNYIMVDKSRPDIPQNFKIMVVNEKSPLFQSFITSTDSFSFDYRVKHQEKLNVRFFEKKIPLPAPPFSERFIDSLVFIPDSIWTINLDNNLIYNYKKEGFYFYQTDTNSIYGFGFGIFDSNFPHVKKPKQLLEPLQYLTSKREFNQLMNEKNIKLAVDNFWLNSAGDIDRAKELIRIFYSRVFIANYYFTSITQGWRTDRGMIYLIFGPPVSVYRDNSSESWVYGDGQAFRSITFKFLKIKTPFTDDFYILRRDVNYKSSWYRAVESWRNGKVYSLSR